jgi:hypothetical protein
MQKTINKSYNAILAIMDIRTDTFYGAKNGFSRLSAEPYIMAVSLWGQCDRPI